MVDSGAAMKINVSQAKTAAVFFSNGAMSNIRIFDKLICVIIIIFITIIIQRIDILQF